MARRAAVLSQLPAAALTFGGALASWLIGKLHPLGEWYWYLLMMPCFVSLMLLPGAANLLDLDTKRVAEALPAIFIAISLIILAFAAVVPEEEMSNAFTVVLPDELYWQVIFLCFGCAVGAQPDTGIRLKQTARGWNVAFVIIVPAIIEARISDTEHGRRSSGLMRSCGLCLLVPDVCLWALQYSSLARVAPNSEARVTYMDPIVGRRLHDLLPPSPPSSPPNALLSDAEAGAAASSSYALPDDALAALTTSVASSIAAQVDSPAESPSWVQRFENAHIADLEEKNAELKEEISELKAESTALEDELERLVTLSEGEMCEGVCPPRTVLTRGVKIWRWTSGNDQLTLCNRCYMDDVPGFWRSDTNLDNSACACGGAGRWRDRNRLRLVCDACHEDEPSDETSEASARGGEAFANAIALAYGGSPNGTGPAWP